MSAFELPFVRDALAVSLLAGNAVALVGLFILMRRVAFSGLAVSQIAALGTVVGGALGHNLGGLSAALVLVGAGIALLSRLSRSRRVPEEAWVAGLYVLGAALAVLLLSRDSHGHGEEFAVHVFFGNILAVGPDEIVEAAALLGIVAAAIVPWLHRWVWIFFDPVAAEVSGIGVRRWSVAFLALFAAAMTVAIHLFGVLLAFAYLLLPGAAALLLCRRLTWLFAAIPLITSSAVVAGAWLSVRLDYPTGPLIAAILAGAVLAAGAFRSFAPSFR